MMRAAFPAALLVFLAFAGVASAQEPQEGDDAWVKDCPPDMMCAAQASEEENATYSGDCGGEVCASGNDTAPGALGPEDCIECMTPPKDESSNCMDGEQAGEDCRDDVYYMTPPTDDAQPAPETATDAEPKAHAVPALQVFGVLGAMAVAVALVARRR